jgi:hypothetical protein
LAEAKSKRFNFDRANDGDSGLSEELMAYGINRFLTTHTGSLPRPDDLIRAMFAKEEGVPVDRTGLSAKIRAAVAEPLVCVVGLGSDAGVVPISGQPATSLWAPGNDADPFGRT